MASFCFAVHIYSSVGYTNQWIAEDEERRSEEHST